ALRAYGTRLEQGILALAAAHEGDVRALLRAVCRHVGDEVAASGYAKGRLAQALATRPAPPDPDITATLARGLGSWIAAIASGLRASGVPRARAETGARAFLAGLEGARTLARATSSSSSFDAVAWAILGALDGAR